MSKKTPAPNPGAPIKSVPVRGPKSAAAAAKREDNPGTVADTLFNATATGPIQLRSGKTLEVQRGKLRHLNLLIQLFTGIINSLPQDQLIEVAKIFHQRALIAQAQGIARDGKEIPQSLADQIAGYERSAQSLEQIADELLTRGGLITRVLSAVIDTLPKVGAALSNLSEQEIEDLDIDESVMVLGACFMGNYAFFSQSLPGLIPAILGAVSQQIQKLASK